MRAEGISIAYGTSRPVALSTHSRSTRPLASLRKLKAAASGRKRQGCAAAPHGGGGGATRPPCGGGRQGGRGAALTTMGATEV